MKFHEPLPIILVSISCFLGDISAFAAGNEPANQNLWISENATCNLHVTSPCDSDACMEAATLGCFNQPGYGCTGQDFIVVDRNGPTLVAPNTSYTYFNYSFDLYCQSTGFTSTYHDWNRPACQDGDSLGENANGDLGICVDRDQAERLADLTNPPSCPAAKDGNPCDAESGDKVIEATDFEGVGIHFYRTWHSKAPKNMSPVGSRWMHSYFDSLDLDAQSVPIAITTPKGEYHTLVATTGGTYIATAINALRIKASGSDWIAEYPNGEKRTYDTNGRLSSVEAAPGQLTTLAYNVSNQLATVTGPFGHQIGLSYDSNGKIEGFSTPNGQEVGYIYSAINGNHILAGVRGYGSVWGFTVWYQYDDTNFPDFITGIVDEMSAQHATYTYDAATGNVLSSEHAGGAGEVNLSYSANSTTVTDGDGRVKTYNFATSPFAGRRLSSTTKNGTTKTYAFASSSTDPDLRRMESVTDELGNVTTYTYDDHHRVSMTRAAGTSIAHTTTYEYLRPDSNKVTKIKRPSAHSSSDAETTITYNSLDLPLTITEAGFDSSQNAISKTTTFTYNAYGQVLTVDGPRTDVTDVTTYEYYDCTTGGNCGQLKSITNAAGHVTSFSMHDGLGNVKRIVDINGFNHHYNRDARGRVYQYIKYPPRGWPASVYSVGYNNADLLVSSPTGNAMTALTFGYDDAHRLVQVTDVLGNKLKYEHDSAGNVTEESTEDPGGSVKRLVNKTYDNFSRLDTVSNAGAVTDIVMDAIGNLTESEDPNLHATTYIYDALNRLTEVEDADTNSALTAYDVNNLAVQVTAANGVVTSYVYDDLGNLESETSPDRGTITYTHDAAGNVLTVTDARNIAATYAYDAINRITSISYPDTSKNVTFGYDAGADSDGLLTSMSDESGSTTWQYYVPDAQTSYYLNLKTQITNGHSILTAIRKAWSSDWIDGSGASTGLRVNYGSTTNGQIASISVNGTTVLSNVTYDPFGQATGWTWGNAATASFNFNQRGEITSHSVGLDTRTLTYDPASQLLTQSDAEYDMTYTYDNIGRNATFAATPNNGGTLVPGSQVFTFDENGNRTSIAEGLYYLNTITANTNRLASTAGPVPKTYTYDAAGNVISDGVHTYSYDDRGRLESIDSGATTYQYNALGERVSKSTGSTTRIFVYGFDRELIGEYDGSGQLIQETVWFEGRPVAVKEAGKLYYVHTDHLGTPRAVSDGNTVVWRWDSDSFGSTPADEDPDGNSTLFTYNLRFPGQYYDVETGLHYNYYRTYDPSTGRYVESDPIGLGGGLNTYGYVGGNPLSYVDPYGLETKTEQEWHDFLNSMELPTISQKSAIPARSLELRRNQQAQNSLLLETAARQAALEGSELACDILAAEATGLLMLAGVGEGYIAARGVQWVALNQIEKGRVLLCAMGLCNPKTVESVAGESRIVIESTLQVVRDMRRLEKIKEAANAARQTTTHVPL